MTDEYQFQYVFDRTVRPDSKLRSSFENLSKAMAGVELDKDVKRDTFKVYNEFDDHLEKVNGPKIENEHENLLSLVNSTVAIDSL